MPMRLPAHGECGEEDEEAEITKLKLLVERNRARIQLLRYTKDIYGRYGLSYKSPPHARGMAR